MQPIVPVDPIPGLDPALSAHTYSLSLNPNPSQKSVPRSDQHPAVGQHRHGQPMGGQQLTMFRVPEGMCLQRSQSLLREFQVTHSWSRLLA